MAEFVQDEQPLHPDYPLPDVDDPVMRPFWDGARDGKLMQQRDRATGARALAAEAALLEGRRSARVVRGERAGDASTPTSSAHEPFLPALRHLLPHIMVVVELGGGRAHRRAHGRAARPRRCAFGMPVRVVFKRLTDRVTLPVWDRIADAGVGGAPRGVASRVEELVDRFGLLAVFFGTAVEGDLGLILGGVAAHLGLMHPLAVGVAGRARRLRGDAAWFAVGRRNADAFRRSARVPPGRSHRRASRRTLRPAQILLARPVCGTRVATMLFWGTQRLAPARFAALDLPACAVWAVLLVSLGYFSSGSVAALLGKVRHVEEWLAVAVVVALVDRARACISSRGVRPAASLIATCV